MKSPLALCLLFFLGLTCFAEPLRVRVVVHEARIRAEPSVESPALASPPLGSLLEAVRKAGAWYEVKVESNLGVAVTGYIHEMFVEVMGEEAATKETVPEPVEEMRPEKKPSRAPGDRTAFGLGFMGGMVTGGASIGGPTSYSARWSDTRLSMVNEEGTIAHSLQMSTGFGLSLHYLFAGGLGIQVRADLNSGKSLNEGTDRSAYTLTWSWASGSGSYQSDGQWNVDGELALSAFSLDLIYQIGQGIVCPYIGAGATLFSGRAEISSRRGLAFSYSHDGYQRIEYIALPASVREDLNGLGFNITGGVAFKFLRNLAVVIDAAYFGGKTKDGVWAIETGTYNGIHFPEMAVRVESDLADAIAATMDTVPINPSFFKVQGGIRLDF